MQNTQLTTTENTQNTQPKSVNTAEVSNTGNSQLQRILTYSISGNAIKPQEIADRLEKAGVGKDAIKIMNSGLSVKIDNPTTEQLDIIHEMSPSDPFRLLHNDNWLNRRWPVYHSVRYDDVHPFSSMLRSLDYLDSTFNAFRPFRIPYHHCPQLTSTQSLAPQSAPQPSDEQLQNMLKSLDAKETIDSEMMKSLIQNELQRRSK